MTTEQGKMRFQIWIDGDGHEQPFVLDTTRGGPDAPLSHRIVNSAYSMTDARATRDYLNQFERELVPGWD